jgi:SAM-dependent methyltransferase
MKLEAEDLKKMVRQKYSLIAEQSKVKNASSCCGSGSSCAEVDYTIFSEKYELLDGYAPEADLGLGCGLPTEFAHFSKGQTVVDLGSGAGNDCFVARALVGETGRVIGVDMTEAMIAKARVNAAKLGFGNVEFRLGEIENMPLDDATVDVIISNCVLNLVPNKSAAFAEIFRVLKPGGHFSISDVVLLGALPEALAHDAEMYAGCVSGAIQKAEYLRLIEQNGFTGVEVQKEKKIEIPDEILTNYLSAHELEAFKADEIGIFSITVFAKK